MDGADRAARCPTGTESSSLRVSLSRSRSFTTAAVLVARIQRLPARGQLTVLGLSCLGEGLATMAFGLAPAVGFALACWAVAAADVLSGPVAIAVLLRHADNAMRGRLMALWTATATAALAPVVPGRRHPGGPASPQGSWPSACSWRSLAGRGWRCCAEVSSTRPRGHERRRQGPTFVLAAYCCHIDQPRIESGPVIPTHSMWCGASPTVSGPANFDEPGGPTG
ncbi:hypothetical protein ACN27G_01135 [Plantactinospora sp. WMMB334]|uniref:hypothetical protein n=1 Tax=Plantactinospora sp. WMMB334 TaxID=3404119 RepID=UPI003B945B31